MHNQASAIVNQHKRSNETQIRFTSLQSTLERAMQALLDQIRELGNIHALYWELEKAFREPVPPQKLNAVQ